MLERSIIGLNFLCCPHPKRFSSKSQGVGSEVMDYCMDAMITLDKTPVLSNPETTEQADLQQFDIFPAPNYRVRVNVYPTDEICIRFVPYVKDGGNNEQDRQNKLLALEDKTVKGVKKQTVYLSRLDWIAIRNKPKKTSKDSLPGWGSLPTKREFKLETKRNIQRRTAAIQRKFGKKRTKFGTITLPGSTDAAMAAIAKYSSYINNRTNRFISSIIGKDAKYRVQVWEFQRRGALHSHFVLGSSNDAGLQMLKEKFPSFCYRLFLDVSRKSGVDLFGRKNGGTWKDRPDVLRCDIQDIKKDAAAYISKYMSKNVKISRVDKDSIDKKEVVDKLYFPTKWASWGWGATQALHQRTIRLKEKRISQAGCEKLTKKCIELTQKYSEGKYQKPLLYLDRIGYGVNIKLLIKTENIEDTIDELQEFISNSIDLKDKRVTAKKVPIEMVWNMWYEEGMQALKEEAIFKKYGDRDARRYLKAFRSNTHLIPEGSTSEQWSEYWHSRE